MKAPAEEKRATAAACVRASCGGCSIRDRVLCIHTPRDLVDFGVLFVGWLIPFLAGMIRGKHWVGLAVWFGLCLVFFGYVEAMVLCRHCPHYAEEGPTLRCHANWGLPKIPGLNRRPVSRIEGTVWLIYGGTLFLYHIPFFIASRQWLLLALATWAVFVAAWTVRRTQCTRCYHLSCPANRVADDVRKELCVNYPAYAEAWRRQRNADGMAGDSGS